MADLRRSRSPLTDPVLSQQARDRTEAELFDAVGLAMRKYLAKVQTELGKRVRSGQTVLTAAGPYDPITVGVMTQWWSTMIRQYIIQAVATAWRNAYSGRDVDSAVREAVEKYLPEVVDRLVPGEVSIGGQPAPKISEDSFDRARILLARSAAEGWTRKQLAARIAAEFNWETNGPAWRAELTILNYQLDKILDREGAPGSALREALRTGRLPLPDGGSISLKAAELRDNLDRYDLTPDQYQRLIDLRREVDRLQSDRVKFVKWLDEEREGPPGDQEGELDLETYWQKRAELIARTESTSLHGDAAQRALAEEGFSHKQWIATSDARTRPEHRQAGGLVPGVGVQVVPVGEPFVVGHDLMQYPGDPHASVEMIANCRCTMIGTDTPETAEAPWPDNFADGDAEDYYRHLFNLQGDDTPAARELMAQLGQLPEGAHRMLRDYLAGTDRGGIYIGDVGLTELDHLQHLSGKQPRGWPEGSTWDEVGGVFNAANRVVAVSGNGATGSVDTLLHELSHALDAAGGVGGRNYARRPDFWKIMDDFQSRATLSPYFRPEGNPGWGWVDESFAEGYASYALHRAKPRAVQLDQLSQALTGHSLDYYGKDKARTSLETLLDYFAGLRVSGPGYV